MNPPQRVTCTFNVYCDESCHLENDRSKAMVLGAVWCRLDRVRSISKRLRDIKRKHDLAESFEIKWTKVSPAKVDFYLDLVDYFFDEDDVFFRGIVIPDKSVLDHQSWNQSHDEWYYKMCFRMLEPLIDPVHKYRIYLDIKDTRSESRRRKLQEVLQTSRYDHYGEIIERVQQIRSNESELMQLADLLIGAVGYQNRRLASSAAKVEVVRRVQRRSAKSLMHTTWLREKKLNLLVWSAEGASN